MPDSSLWDRYHQLIQEYIATGDEKDLREVVSLSQEQGLSLETTSGRVAASVRAVLSAYTSIGADSMKVDIHRGAPPADRQLNSATDSARAECLVTLSTPELGKDAVVIEIRGRCTNQRLPIVRLDYVRPDQVNPDQASPRSAESPSAPPALSQPIEPRQLYDVLIGLLAQNPEPPV